MTTTTRSQAHHTFTIERTYPHPVEHVWAAFADPGAKRRWFGAEGEDVVVDAWSDDFRVGGHGVSDGRFGDGPMHRFLSTYTDIVEHERIVYTYDMWLDDDHISTSLTTVLLEPTDGGTLLTLVEQGVHLDGHDDGSMREHGMGELLDTLGARL